MREMTLRGKAKFEADIGNRRPRTHQAIECPFDTHGVCVERRGHSRIFAEEFEEMRARKADISRHGLEFDALGTAVIQETQRLAHPEIDEGPSGSGGFTDSSSR